MEELLSAMFLPQGYQLSEFVPEELTYRPEIIFKQGSTLKIFHIKDSSKLRETIIQRISQAKKITSTEYEQFLVFPEKPGIAILKTCKLYRVGIYYVNTNGQLELYAEPEVVKGRTKKAQIPNTKIFFSSRQSLQERTIAKNVITLHREANKLSVFANLVEDDQRYDNNIDDLLDIINDVMNDSDYVLCILAEEYRAIVEQEVRRALQNYEPREILLFLKNNKESKESWTDLLNYIHSSTKVKYTEYLDDRDFEIKFTRRLMIVLKELHIKHNVEFLG